MNKPHDTNEFTIHLNVNVNIVNEQENNLLHAVQSILEKVLAGQKRIERKFMDVTQALDLLSTNVDDLDAAIQEEIRQFEELKNSQDGVLTPEQQERFDGLIARIQQQKAALDADDTPPA